MKRVADADLRLLRIFATVVECKGFAVAQAELNLSASSISGYISALEQRLGVRLCTRGRAGFSITDKGAVIYREAQRPIKTVVSTHHSLFFNVLHYELRNHVGAPLQYATSSMMHA